MRGRTADRGGGERLAVGEGWSGGGVQSQTGGGFTESLAHGAGYDTRRGGSVFMSILVRLAPGLLGQRYPELTLRFNSSRRHLPLNLGVASDHHRRATIGISDDQRAFEHQADCHLAYCPYFSN